MHVLFLCLPVYVQAYICSCDHFIDIIFVFLIFYLASIIAVFSDRSAFSHFSAGQVPLLRTTFWIWKYPYMVAVKCSHPPNPLFFAPFSKYCLFQSQVSRLFSHKSAGILDLSCWGSTVSNLQLHILKGAGKPKHVQMETIKMIKG